jgi:hypothetical protein
VFDVVEYGEACIVAMDKLYVNAVRANDVRAQIAVSYSAWETGPACQALTRTLREGLRSRPALVDVDDLVVTAFGGYLRRAMRKTYAAALAAALAPEVVSFGTDGRAPGARTLAEMPATVRGSAAGLAYVAGASIRAHLKLWGGREHRKRFSKSSRRKDPRKTTLILRLCVVPTGVDSPAASPIQEPRRAQEEGRAAAAKE